jgi:hypothetical protein
VPGDVADITIRTRLAGQTRHIRRDDKMRTLKALDLPRPKPVTDADTVQEKKRRILSPTESMQRHVHGARD